MYSYGNELKDISTRVQENVTVVPVRVLNGAMLNICYVLANEITKDAIIIDPAWEPRKIERILEKHKLQLKCVVLTHSHFDHVDLCEFFSKKYSTPVYMSEVEVGYYNFCCFNLVTFRDNECLRAGGFEIVTIPTPGHTKGSTCLHIGNNLFTGDTLFTEGCGACIGAGSDPYYLYESLSKLKKLLPSDVRVYAGHSYGEEVGQTMSTVIKKNIYLNFNSAEKFVKFRMRRNQKSLLSFG